LHTARSRITLDGKYAFVSDPGGSDLPIVDVATRKPFRTMKMGAIDLKTFAVTGEVKAGRGPDGLAWASRK
jgi:hypothetical protein